MLINGKHISADDLAEVKNPYNGEVIDTVPVSHLIMWIWLLMLQLGIKFYSGNVCI